PRAPAAAASAAVVSRRSSGDQRMESGARELALAEEANDSSLAQLDGIRAAVAARDQHDANALLPRMQLPNDLEPVHAGKLHIEDYHVGRERLHRRQGRRPVCRDADDVEALELEERARGATEVLVVVDDQQPRPSHLVIVADRALENTMASTGRRLLPAAFRPRGSTRTVEHELQI